MSGFDRYLDGYAGYPKPDPYEKWAARRRERAGLKLAYQGPLQPVAARLFAAAVVQAAEDAEAPIV